MSLLSEFFLNSPSHIRQLDLIEITHPNFGNTSGWRLVRNEVAGVTVDHESAGGTFFYAYCPMSLRPVGSGADLGQSLNVNFGDLGSILGSELLTLYEANALHIRPVIKFRTYRSDDLTEPMSGPLVLEVVKLTTTEDGCLLECQAPNVNNTRTGTQYAIDQFPMLRGFLV